MPIDSGLPLRMPCAFPPWTSAPLVFALQVVRAGLFFSLEEPKDSTPMEFIEVRLNEDQHRQLMGEARAAGQKFFDYCRAKLTQPLNDESYGQSPVMAELPRLQADNEQKRIEIREADRMSRIEDAIAQLTQVVMGQAGQPTETEPQTTETTPIDVDSIVDAQFHEAEAAGLTERVPDENEEVMRHAGVRPLSRRAIPFSSTPRHLQGL